MIYFYNIEIAQTAHNSDFAGLQVLRKTNRRRVAKTISETSSENKRE
jgi:hypothetical protein